MHRGLFQPFGLYVSYGAAHLNEHIDGCRDGGVRKQTLITFSDADEALRSFISAGLQRCTPDRIQAPHALKSTSRTRERFGKYYMYTAFSKV